MDHLGGSDNRMSVAFEDVVLTTVCEEKGKWLMPKYMSQ